MITIIIMLLIILSQNNEKRFELRNEPCRRSTISNPWSNLVPYSNDPEAKACKSSRKEIEDNMYYGFLRDQDDDVQRAKMNAFYTLPVTTSLTMHNDFANFQLYGYEDNKCFCKRDKVGCERYRDVRFNF